MKTNKLFALGLALGLVVSGVSAQNKLFSELVGRVGAVKTTGGLRVPFIIWGGDMATFYANGG